MHDGVADVLHEREALARHNPLGIVASILLHLGIAALFVFGSRQSRPDDLKQIVNVRLAPIARPQQPMVRPAAPQPATPAVEKAPEPKPEEVRKEEPKKPEAKAVEKSLFGKSEKKPAPEKPVKPAPAPSPSTGPAAPAPGAGATLPAVGTAGVTGLEGGDFPYTIYIDRMISLIGARWFRPQVSADLIVQVYFVIERDGTIRDIAVEKESGSSLFDRAALRAVREASPLPPLPFGYGGSYLGVHLTFH